MRLLDNAVRKGLILGLTVVLAACGRGGGEPPAVASASGSVPSVGANGPSADYPQVLGEPYSVAGEVYTPEDVLSYDSVGYAALDSSAGPGAVVSHKTLPMPSYVEITSLDSGTTILARVTARGPMTSSHLVGLSPDAAAQIGVAEGAAVRVRRVNPPEHERAELRAGKSVPNRLEVPKSLVAVLRQKLPVSGSASLRSGAAQQASHGWAQSPAAAPGSAPSEIARIPVPASAPKELPALAAAEPAQDVVRQFDDAFSGDTPQTNRSYPLPPMTGMANAPAMPAARPVAAAQRPVVVAAAQQAAPSDFSLPGRQTRVAAAPTPTPTPTPTPATAAPAPARSTANIVEQEGSFVVQAAAFSSKDNADRAASNLDGFVRKAGRFYRVRTGPYATRGQAEAALAKVRAAGYSDARVFTAG